MPLNIVIGGGTGFIGRALVDSLRANGHNVTVISRTPCGTNCISWDYIKNDGLPPNTDAVVNFSGSQFITMGHRWNPEACRKLVKETRINTTRWLCDAIESAPRKPKVWISTSAIGYYKTSATNIYDEDSPGGTKEYPATMIADWEESARLSENCHSVRQVIVRLGPVLGSGKYIAGYLRMFRYGLGAQIGDGKRWMSWIHMDDVVGIYTHAIENENVTAVLNAVSPNAVTSKEFTNELAGMLHRPSCCKIPEWLIRLFLGDDELADFVLIGQNAVPKRVLSLGYRFKFAALEVALKDIVG